MTADQATLDTRLLLNVLTAVKGGDFSARLPVDWTGINGKIADTFNEIIAMNEKTTKELARVSRVVGQEGKITQRAALGDGGGGWAGMVDSVNTLIGDLVWPTSEMARVVGAVAKGDLSQSVPLEVEGRPLKGEFLRTAKTVNVMVEQLNGFTSEVTRVAREVGTEGKLGGQAVVPGVSGTRKKLTDNVLRIRMIRRSVAMMVDDAIGVREAPAEALIPADAVMCARCQWLTASSGPPRATLSGR